MRRWSWVLGWLMAGGAGCGGESKTLAPVAEVEFQRLEQTTYPGFVSPSPPDAACELASEPTVLHLDAPSSVLTWRTCDLSSEGVVELDEGRTIIDAGDMTRVRQTLANIHPRKGVCAYDGDALLLDLLTEKGMDRMGDAVSEGACHEPPGGRYEGRRLVDGIPALHDLLINVLSGG